MGGGWVWSVVLILTISPSLLGCGRGAQESDAQKRAQEEQGLRTQLLAIASKWQAEPNWKSRIKNIEQREIIYSAEVDRALTTRPSERFLFLGTIEDVMVNPDGRYRVLVAPSLSDSDPPLYLDLTCAGDVVRPLFEAEGRILQEYAVIASVEQVRRRIVLSPQSDGGEARIDVSGEHLGVGNCLAFVPVESDK